MHPNFKGQFPRSVAAGLTPVSTAKGVEHSGFDDNDVKTALGTTRYNNLVAAILTAGYSGAVFSCGHRTVNGVEVHCFYAADVEKFLLNGG